MPNQIEADRGIATMTAASPHTLWCMNRPPLGSPPSGFASQTIRTETGMPSLVIRLSALHPIFASVR